MLVQMAEDVIARMHAVEGKCESVGMDEYEQKLSGTHGLRCTIHNVVTVQRSSAHICGKLTTTQGYDIEYVTHQSASGAGTNSSTYSFLMLLASVLEIHLG